MRLPQLIFKPLALMNHHNANHQAKCTEFFKNLKIGKGYFYLGTYHAVKSILVEVGLSETHGLYTSL